MNDRTEQARQWLQSIKGQWTAFTMETGLNPHWVAKFAQGVIEHPQGWRVDLVLEQRAKAMRRKR